jgi:hypothetical protein
VVSDEWGSAPATVSGDHTYVVLLSEGELDGGSRAAHRLVNYRRASDALHRPSERENLYGGARLRALPLYDLSGTEAGHCR